MKFFNTGLLILFLSLLFAVTTRAQESEPRTREITSDDFVKKRPARKSKGVRVKKASRYRKKRYKYARKTKRRKRRRSRPKRRKKVLAKKNVVAKKKRVAAQVGVTMWKLRPAKAGETGPFVSVKLSDSLDGVWTPERVGGETIFREGDRIRLAIESSQKGFLYVINSEIYDDGTIGDPFLIFPASLDKNNRVEPGILVDIPDQTERYPYFLIQTKRRDYAGESLLVIITQKPLTNLKIDASGKIRNADVIDEFEDSASAEMFSRTDGIGSTLTLDERDATCGNGKRGLSVVYGKPGKPCGPATRRLTLNSPPPQTIYKTNYFPGEPISFPLSIRVADSRTG